MYIYSKFINIIYIALSQYKFKETYIQKISRRNKSLQQTNRDYTENTAI